MMDIKYKQIVTLVLFISMVALVYFAQSSQDLNNDESIIITINDCHPQSGECLVMLGSVKMNVSLNKKIKYLEPFNIKVEFDSEKKFTVDSVNILFKMLNMDMGLNRFSLKKKDNEQKNKVQAWVGKAVLPVCITGRADWVSELEINTNNKYKISFPITVSNNRT